MKKLLIVCMAVAATFPALAQKQESAPKVLSAPGGRYVFGQISEFRRDQFMLDTQTGRLWKIVLQKSKRQDGTEMEFEMLDHIPYTTESFQATPPPASR